MHKRKIVVISLLLMFLLTIVATGCGQKSENTLDDQNTAITGVATEFINALGANNKSKIKSFLTKEHLDGITDTIFLVSDEAAEEYDIEIKNIFTEAVSYSAYEEVEDITADLVVFYTVVISKDGEIVEERRIRESFIFQEVNSRWLIASNKREIAR
ncbi:MAG: hypothetical protein SCM57_07860 [Bacillota bacterium]|nr:hypothetical protein [Bacillota bacterium]